MRFVPVFPRAARLAVAALSFRPVRWPFGLGRPLAALLVLALLGGAVTSARSLLDLRQTSLGRADEDWRTFVAAGSDDLASGPGFAPAVADPSIAAVSIADERPPLRIDIMGMGGIARVERTAGDAVAPTVPTP